MLFIWAAWLNFCFRNLAGASSNHCEVGKDGLLLLQYLTLDQSSRRFLWLPRGCLDYVISSLPIQYYQCKRQRELPSFWIAYWLLFPKENHTRLLRDVSVVLSEELVKNRLCVCVCTHMGSARAAGRSLWLEFWWACFWLSFIPALFFPVDIFPVTADLCWFKSRGKICKNRRGIYLPTNGINVSSFYVIKQCHLVF